MNELSSMNDIIERADDYFTDVVAEWQAALIRRDYKMAEYLEEESAALTTWLVMIGAINSGGTDD